MIDSNHSKTLHLIVALPLAASIPGILLTLLMALSHIEPINSILDIFSALLGFLVMALFLSLCISIVSAPIALVSYLILKKFNQLKLWVFIFFGFAFGAVIILAYKVDSKQVEMGYVLGLCIGVI